MTSNVKSGLPMVWHFLLPLVRRPSAEPEPGRDDGWSCWYPWVGSHLPCVRRVPASLSARGFVSASERHRGVQHTGAASRPMPRQSCVTTDGKRSTGSREGSQRNLLGHGPHTRTQFPSDGDDHLGSIFPSGAQLSGALAQAYRGLPTHILDRLGHLLTAQWQMPA